MGVSFPRTVYTGSLGEAACKPEVRPGMMTTMSTIAPQPADRPRVSVEHIEITPGVCGGRPRIAGTRIRVQDIYVWHELRGRSPDEIVNDFPQLTLAQVHAALAYYFDHRDEIRRQMAEEEALVEEARRTNPSPLREKLAKLAQRHATDDPVPPG
jgi:uncharacterized protein (DUF433 family)